MAAPDKKTLEEGSDFIPRFGADGLTPCVTVGKDGKVLMVAYMNREALDKTIATGEAHYWSRSRNELWHKGATSGQIQKVKELRVDCDQDCILLTVDADAACHTGRKSCFYRVLKNGKLVFSE